MVYFDIQGLILVTNCFHSLQSHKSCPSSFNLEYCKEAIRDHLWSTMNKVNASAVEQLNAKLQNLEKHISDDVLNPISTKPIFLPYDHGEYTTNRSIVDGFLHGKIPHLILPYDQNAKCEHGNQFASGRPKDDWLMIKGRKKHPPVLVTLNAIRRVDVYYRPTIGSCDCKQFYDRKENAILNMWDNFLVTHELMLNFETLLQYNPITINGYVHAWNTNCKMYVSCYTISVNAFRIAYCAFVKLCRPREERMLFRCEICEQAPRQTLVCDGIQLGSVV